MRKLLQRFNDFSIRFKLGFVLFIPLVFLVYVTTEYLFSERDRLAQAELNTVAFQLIEELDRTIHNLALERGLSAGFIGSRQQQQQLQSQRKQTSQQLMVLFQELERDKNSSMIFDDEEVVELRWLLRKLPDIRKLIGQKESGERALHDSFEFFSLVNAKLLYLIQEGVSTVGQPSLAKQSRALYSLLSIKERAGQERGRLNNFFSSGKLSTNANIEINHYVHDQHIKLEEFFHHASPDYVDRYREKIIPMERNRLHPYRELFFSRMEKEEMLERLRGALGFGGMIHSFKNYVVRGDTALRFRFEQNYGQIMALLGRYRTLSGISEGELKLLDIVEQNINAYHQNIRLIPDNSVTSRRIVEIDQIVKVNDEPALKALNQLSLLSGVDATAWFEHSTARIEQIGSLANSIRTELRRTAKSNQESIARTYSFYKNGLLFMLLLTIWLALYVWRQLSNSITHTLDVIHHTEQSGDISARISVVNRDEIGAIGSAINTLFKTYQQLIHEAIEVLNNVAGGEFGHQINTSFKGDLKNLKSGVNLAVERIKQSTQAKDEFLASMSHELRTPLTAIIGNSEYLLERDPDSGRQKVLSDIESAGRSQLALVNDILDMSKIESGKFTIENTPYDLSQLLSEIRSMLSIRSRDAGLELLVEQKNREAYQLIGDSQRIGQILINLLSNAIKFTDSGSITLATWVTAEQLLFQVEDTGIGMTPEVRERLFQRFEQADGSISRRFGGSGLGLYISLNLAELMGGTITVSSREGEGSVFKLILPYQQSDQRVGTSVESGLDESLLNEKISGNVLVAEDTPELQMLERRILEGMGLTVTIAENGKEAVELAMSRPFDLILMDMQMPVMNGIEATQRLRELSSAVPVVALTANVMQKHREEFEWAGGSGFLGKPIDTVELRKLIKEHIRQESQPIKRIVWSARYSVGSATMDQQHQRLFEYINQMIGCYADIESSSSRQKILEILPEFHNCAAQHFKAEEALLSEVNYPDLKSHIASHNRYDERITACYQSAMDEKQTCSLIEFLLNWWGRHTLEKDMAYKEYLYEQPLDGAVTKLPPEEAEDEVDDELMAIFVESTTQRKAVLTQALSTKDWQQVREIAHATKGSAASFGHLHLTKMAETLQLALDEERFDEASCLADDLMVAMEKVLP